MDKDTFIMRAGYRNQFARLSMEERGELTSTQGNARGTGRTEPWGDAPGGRKAEDPSALRKTNRFPKNRTVLTRNPKTLMIVIVIVMVIMRVK